MGIISNRAINFISNDSLLQRLLVKDVEKNHTDTLLLRILLLYESSPRNIYLHNHTDSETVNDTFFVIIDP